MVRTAIVRRGRQSRRALFSSSVAAAAAAFIVALAQLAQGYDLEFAIEPQDTIVQSGHSAVLDCVVKSSEDTASTIVTQWLDEDHQPLAFLGDAYRSQLTNGSLYISSVLEEQGLSLTGAYQCKASLPGGASIVSRTAHLSLASISSFQQQPQDNTVFLGQKAHFACKVRASPAPRIRWLKDERPLQIDEIRMTVLPSGALEIDEVKESDQGMYRCNASGPNTHLLSTKAHLLINEDTDQEDYTNMPPKFIAEPMAQVATEGQTVTLDCAANGNPAPVIKWLKDGYNIDMADLDSRFSLIGSSSSLKISNIQEEDAGTYQCRASNQVDSYDKSATIDVQVPPRFVDKPKPRVEMEHNVVEFECTVYGKPEPKVSWLKNGEHINTNEYYQIVNGNNLKITGLMKSDAGLFQCVATNAAGNVQAAASLAVTDDVKASSPEPAKKRRKKGHKHRIDGQSRQLFVSLKSETPDAPLGDVEFGYTGHKSTTLSHPSYDPKSVLTSLQPDHEQGGDKAFTDVTLPQSKPLLIVDDGSHGEVSIGPPQDLKAPVVKARFVVLSWKPPASNVDDIIAYSVYYRQEGSERERVQNTTRSKLEEINIGSLQPAKVYNFRVVAFTELGVGASSETLTVTTQSEENVPSAPRDFEAYANGIRSIHVSWKVPETPNGAILRYKVYYMETVQSVEYNAETTSTEFDIIALSVFTKYNIWVVAINNNGPGAASEDKTIQTFGDEPSEPPYNVTLEPSSSTSILVRWEPPPLEGQNGIITGYKLRYRIQGKKGGNTITTPANTRMHTLSDLERSTKYQVKLWAMNVNGTGPPTDWFDIETYENDLDESRVPDEPGPLRVRPVSDKIYVMWSPPANQNIKIRNYILGWGKGIPDIFAHELDEKLRQFIIERLEPNSDYVISLRASNSVGAGPPVYANVRTREEAPPEVPIPLTPPIGLKAQVLSQSSVILYWVDTTLSKSQYVRDSRYYTIEYTYHAGKTPKTRALNVTNLNVMIDDLKPATQYEFMVKVVKGRRESPWSMVVTNTTWDVAPSTAPRDLTASLAEGNSQLVELSWQPPKQHSGHVTGYIIMYTTDNTKKDREWRVEAVKADKQKFLLTDLKPSTVYYFKIQARNNRGNGPFSSTIQFQTGENFIDRSVGSNSVEESKPLFEHSTLFIIIVAALGLLVVTTVFIITVVLCRRRTQSPASPDRSKKGYQKGNQNIKPPDLWIHHDQMELKNLEKGHNNDGASSSGAMTLPRSVGNNEYDERDAHPTNSLDKRTYISNNYMAVATATPINNSTLSSDTTPNRPFPRSTQYTMSRAHVTLDPPGQPTENLYSAHPNYENNGTPYLSTCPPPVAHVPPSAYAPGMAILAESQAAKRLQATGHPLKSFTVPAPPPISAPGTPQPKHVVTSSPPLIVRPNASPYKKAPSSGSGSVSVSSTPPSRIASNPPPHNADEIQRLQPSHSTEELNQEMANLEGLMMTLNAITANEFEC
ncbi:neogenin isoform X4 [Atheta coriaria]|uniref:neogenin isoform X4 n=1 Tax=Dalotia coriaria TaxID=877792 RepID=UPI0031F432B5